MAHLSLRERCQKLNDKYNVSISPQGLARFYKANGIRWRLTKYAYRNEARFEESILEERKAWAVKYHQWVLDNRGVGQTAEEAISHPENVVFWDESSFHANVRLNRTWTD